MWHPIETAPRDGSSILAVVAGRHPECGKPYIPAVVWWDHEWGWMEHEWGREDTDPHSWHLTHWMPLPAPPEIDT
jgi:hypothetical protein